MTQQLAQMSSPRSRPAPDDETEVEMLRRQLRAVEAERDQAAEEQKVKRDRDEVSSGSNRNYGGSQRTN